MNILRLSPSLETSLAFDFFTVATLVLTPSIPFVPGTKYSKNGRGM